MPQKWQYTTPQSIGPNSTGVEMILLEKMRKPDWFLRIVFEDNQGRRKEMSRSGDAAKVLIIALNKNNNAVKPEEQRVLEWAATQPDGLKAGAITGTPD